MIIGSGAPPRMVDQARATAQQRAVRAVFTRNRALFSWALKPTRAGMHTGERRQGRVATSRPTGLGLGEVALLVQHRRVVALRLQGTVPLARANAKRTAGHSRWCLVSGFWCWRSRSFHAVARSPHPRYTRPSRNAAGWAGQRRGVGEGPPCPSTKPVLGVQGACWPAHARWRVCALAGRFLSTHRRLSFCSRSMSAASSSLAPSGGAAMAVAVVAAPDTLAAPPAPATNPVSGS